MGVNGRKKWSTKKLILIIWQGFNRAANGICKSRVK